MEWDHFVHRRCRFHMSLDTELFQKERTKKIDGKNVFKKSTKKFLLSSCHRHHIFKSVDTYWTKAEKNVSKWNHHHHEMNGKLTKNEMKSNPTWKPEMSSLSSLCVNNWEFCSLCFGEKKCLFIPTDKQWFQIYFRFTEFIIWSGSNFCFVCWFRVQNTYFIVICHFWFETKLGISILQLIHDRRRWMSPLSGKFFKCLHPVFPYLMSCFAENFKFFLQLIIVIKNDMMEENKKIFIT